ncbi:MAG: phosphate ABC transporter substrate-binding protein [Syntrophomonadaceae bacterium]
MFSERRLNKAGWLLVGMFFWGLAAISGCGQKESTIDNGAVLRGTLTVAGSTSVQPFSEVLAEEFMAANPGVKINVQGGGSSVGIESAVSGAAGIGAVSRTVTAAEMAQGLTWRVIALDGIALVVNPANPISNLKTEDVVNIYLGNINNWKELGGIDAPITVVTREEGSGTREAFASLVMNKKDIIKSAIVQNSTGAIVATVAGDKNGVGYVSLSSIRPEVKALSIDGIPATEINVRTRDYKLQRPFIFVTKGEPTGLAKAFIDYVLSPEGQKLIVEEGAISASR